jgi:dihydroorotate dehydrogenase electron transfer subunit
MQAETVRVLEQKKFSGDYRLVKFSSNKIAPEVRPGQFVHLRVTGLAEHVLRRPFSVFKAGKNSLSILYKIVGAGTKIMAELKPGDKASMMGPLGNGFPLPAAKVRPVLVAGGYGSAALYLLAERSCRKGIIFIGGRTSGDILCVNDFRRLGWKVFVATEDGSQGQKGLVTDILANYMGISDGRAAQPVRQRIPGGTRLSRPTCENTGSLTDDTNGRQITLCACGPMGMLKAVAGIAMAGGWKAWLSLDKNMGCGVGACLACVQKIRAPGGKGWKWARICTEGPVFECREIIWE